MFNTTLLIKQKKIPVVLWTFEEDKPSKMIILQWNAEDRKRKGKPREQWMDGVRRNMISKYLTEEDAEDRELWRSKISTIGILYEKNSVK